MRPIDMAPFFPSEAEELIERGFTNRERDALSDIRGGLARLLKPLSVEDLASLGLSPGKIRKLGALAEKRAIEQERRDASINPLSVLAKAIEKTQKDDATSPGDRIRLKVKSDCINSVFEGETYMPANNWSLRLDTTTPEEWYKGSEFKAFQEAFPSKNLRRKILSGLGIFRAVREMLDPKADTEISPFKTNMDGPDLRTNLVQASFWGGKMVLSRGIFFRVPNKSLLGFGGDLDVGFRKITYLEKPAFNELDLDSASASLRFLRNAVVDQEKHPGTAVAQVLGDLAVQKGLTEADRRFLDYKIAGLQALGSYDLHVKSEVVSYPLLEIVSYDFISRYPQMRDREISPTTTERLLRNLGLLGENETLYERLGRISRIVSNRGGVQMRTDQNGCARIEPTGVDSYNLSYGISNKEVLGRDVGVKLVFEKINERFGKGTVLPPEGNYGVWFELKTWRAIERCLRVGEA